jgi:hypothetical protein
MAGHTHLSRWNACERGLLDGAVTISTVNAIVAHVMLVTEWQRLLWRSMHRMWIIGAPSPNKNERHEYKQAHERADLQRKYQSSIEYLRHDVS